LRERGSQFLRAADQLIGIPLIAGGSVFFPRKKTAPEQVHSIGILMLGVIGDTLLASAIVPNLRERYPQAKITAFISHANWGTVDLLDGIDDVLVVPATKPLPAIRMLRRHSVDLLIDIGQWARISALLAAFSGARFTIGFKTPGQYRHSLFDATAEHLANRHEIDNFRALLAPLGIPATGFPMLQSDILYEAQQRGRNRTVVFHPWAAGYKSYLREWPEDRWVALALEILDADFDIAITGGPGDYKRAKALTERIARPSVRVLAGSTTLRQTAVLLARAACVISVNTGIMHLAAIVGAPLVALHGPTNPKRWGPINQNSVVLGPGPEEGGAYLNLGFEYPPGVTECMIKISVSDVMQGFWKATGQRATVSNDDPAGTHAQQVFHRPTINAPSLPI